MFYSAGMIARKYPSLLPFQTINHSRLGQPIKLRLTIQHVRQWRYGLSSALSNSYPDYGWRQSDAQKPKQDGDLQAFVLLGDGPREPIPSLNKGALPEYRMLV